MRQHLPLLLLVSLLHLLSASQQAGAAPAPDLPGIAYEQKPGSQLPGPVMFQDDTGRMVRLADLIEGRPLIMVLGYFHCPNLCSVVRASLFGALAESGLVAGRDYSLAAVSIDPSEQSADAAAAKAADLQRYPGPGAAQYWHFLTGGAVAIKSVSDSVGFRSRPNPQRGTFIHPAGVVFATPDARVSSYLLGVGYEPADVRLAVARAKSGAISLPASPVLLLCFDYDLATGRYTLAIMKLLRLAAVITLAALAGGIILARFRESRA
jgi:protein SCO1